MRLYKSGQFTLEACLLGHLWTTAAAIGSSVPGGPVLTILQILFTSSEQLKKKKKSNTEISGVSAFSWGL